MKACVINQPVGLGDIIFCLKIGYHYHDMGYKIVWPIKDVYLDRVKKYINCPFDFIALNEVKFYMGKAPVFTEEFVYLPLDGSERIVGGHIMEAKYKLARVPNYKDWKNYFHIKRDPVKEEELFNKFKLNENEPYTLVTWWYGSPPNSQKMYTKLQNPNIKMVEVDYLKDFSIFDWCKIIEHATEICITDSAISLIVEKLNPRKCKDFTIVSRRPLFNEVQILYELNWNYVVGKKIERK